MPILWLLGAAVFLVIVMRKQGVLGPQTADAYVKGVQTSITLGDIGGGYFLRDDAAASFNLMQAAATQAGIPLTVDSAFRFMSEQTDLYNEFLSGARTSLVAKPGYSNHQGGVAVDIAVQSSTQSATYKWLAENAADYGFVNTGAKFSKPEYWHWEFTGNGNA